MLMNREELKKVFEKSSIPNSYYSLNGGLPSEAYCINQSDKGWEVYYSERGMKSCLKIFDTEEDACLYLKSQVEKY